MYRVPVEEYIEACRDKDIQVIAQNLGLFWWGRPYTAPILFAEPTVFSTEMCRASAATYWQAGVDGIYLWNNQLIEFNRDINYSGQQWREIGDPATLAGRDKHYLADKPPHWERMAVELEAPPVPKGPLPIDIDQPGDTAAVRMDIADDVAAANADGSLAEATLRILLINLTSVDDIEFRLNGEALDRGRRNQAHPLQRILARLRRFVFSRPEPGLERHRDRGEVPQQAHRRPTHPGQPGSDHPLQRPGLIHRTGDGSGVRPSVSNRPKLSADWRARARIS